jgi:hypothetical protein
MTEQNTFYNDDKDISRESTSPVCSFCKRLRDQVDRKCEAFRTIPKSIWDGKIKHKEPYPGDNGLMFVQITLQDIEERIASTKRISESYK